MQVRTLPCGPALCTYSKYHPNTLIEVLIESSLTSDVETGSRGKMNAVSVSYNNVPLTTTGEKQPSMRGNAVEDTIIDVVPSAHSDSCKLRRLLMANRRPISGDSISLFPVTSACMRSPPGRPVVVVVVPVEAEGRSLYSKVCARICPNFPWTTSELNSEST